jgi:hypothetical protein
LTHHSNVVESVVKHSAGVSRRTLPVLAPQICRVELAADSLFSQDGEQFSFAADVSAVGAFPEVFDLVGVVGEVEELAAGLFQEVHQLPGDRICGARPKAGRRNVRLVRDRQAGVRCGCWSVSF